MAFQAGLRSPRQCVLTVLYYNIYKAAQQFCCLHSEKRSLLYIVLPSRIALLHCLMARHITLITAIVVFTINLE